MLDVLVRRASWLAATLFTLIVVANTTARTRISRHHGLSGACFKTDEATHQTKRKGETSHDVDCENGASPVNRAIYSACDRSGSSLRSHGRARAETESERGILDRRQGHFKLLRDKIAELEARSPTRQSESELKSAQERFEHLLASSPAIIYTTLASGTYACTYVSENIRSIMGFTPDEMTTDAKCWPDQLHPDDAERVLSEEMVEDLS